MKYKFWDRVLVAVAGLLVLMLGIGLFVFGVGIFPFTIDPGFLTASYTFWQRLVMVLGALLLCGLGVHSIAMLFIRRRDKGFIMQRTDLGDMSISMKALETMVHKCIGQHEELTVKATRIYRVKDGIVIEIKILLDSGVNIPLTVNALQKQIKQYITSSSGVDVHEVKVLVETGAENPHHPLLNRGEEKKETAAETAPQPVEAPVTQENAAEAPAMQSTPVMTEAPVMETAAEEPETAPVAQEAAQAETTEEAADQQAEEAPEAEVTVGEEEQTTEQPNDEAASEQQKEEWE